MKINPEVEYTESVVRDVTLSRSVTTGPVFIKMKRDHDDSDSDDEFMTHCEYGSIHTGGRSDRKKRRGVCTSQIMGHRHKSSQIVINCCKTP